MAEFVNKVTLQGQLGDFSIHQLSSGDSCVNFVLEVEDSRIDCFTVKSDFYLQAVTGKVHKGDWIRLEGFLHVLPDIVSNVICTAVAVLPE